MPDAFRKKTRTLVEALPIAGPFLIYLKRAIFPAHSFTTSQEYWEGIYASGGNSGPGSYNAPAQFKAAVLNSFIQEQNIKTVLEWGCGDGNQLSLAKYPHYVGADVSRTAVSKCRQMFANDSTKAFYLVDELPEHLQSAECALSLDVIYHLVEDDVYAAYMKRLFASATRFVIIYTWTANEGPPIKAHVRHRAFLKWMDQNITGWSLYKIVKNDHADKNSADAFADFYIFQRQLGDKTAQGA
jgi:SAM-dependent methyltransferase